MARPAVVVAVVLGLAACSASGGADDGAQKRSGVASNGPDEQVVERAGTATTENEHDTTSTTAAAPPATEVAPPDLGAAATDPPDTTTPATNPPAQAAPAEVDPTTPFEEDFFDPSMKDFLSVFDTEVHHRNLVLDYPAGHDFDGSWQGDHDMSCGPPDTQRTVSASEDGTDPEAFWTCAPAGPESGHVMTSMGNVDGYSIVAFSPARRFADASQVCWKVNLTDFGARSWTEVLILPEEAFQANGGSMAYVDPDFETVAGPPAAFAFPDGAVAFDFFSHAIQIWTGREPGVWDQFETFTTDDHAYRYEHCLVDNGDGTITATQERDGGDRVVTVPGSFPDDARVLFKSHAYTPGKDGTAPSATWHWDDIRIG